MHERPDILIVKVGTLDDRTGLNPAAEVWCPAGAGLARTERCPRPVRGRRAVNASVVTDGLRGARAWRLSGGPAGSGAGGLL